MIATDLDQRSKREEELKAALIVIIKDVVCWHVGDPLEALAKPTTERKKQR